MQHTLRNKVSACFLLLWVTFLISHTAHAQDRRITGRVISGKDQQPIPGVNILVRNTQLGTTTDGDGNFTINLAPSRNNESTILVFSAIGFAGQEVTVGNQSQLNITLQEGDQNLSEVIVTALGIKKDSKKLGYATASVNTEQITTNRTVNLGTGLQGKLSGVNVSPAATGAAGTAKIRIRGQSSFKGDNSPLIIVNGIPINNSNFGSRRGDSEGQTTRGENFSDGGDGLLSINPDDIEQMTVLKGATAAALYGFRAKDGAVIITTKTGTKRQGIGVEINSNYTTDRVVDETDFQYEYGQGENGVRPTDLASAQSTGIFSFGEKFDGRPTIQFDGVQRPYSPVRNHIRDFYETGTTFTNTVALSGGSDKGGFHLSFSNLDNKGVVPNSSFKKRSLNLGLNYNLTSKLILSTNINYSNEYIKNPAQVGIQGMNANAAIYTLANSIELDVLRDNRKDVNGNELATSRFTPRNNPYWSTLDRFENIKRDRILGNVSLRYNLTDWLYVQGRLGMDYYTRNNDYNGPTGSRHYSPVPTGFNGFYYQDVQKFRETNLDFLVGATRKFGDFGIDVTLGGNQLYQTSENNNVLVNNFFIRDLYTVMNGQIKDPQFYFSEKKVNSFYGAAEFSFRDYLFVNVTGRNDWFSTLNPESNSYLYPSVSGSFVFSQAAQLPNWLSYGKIRGAYAEVGGDTDPYQNNLYYNLLANTFVDGQPLAQIGTGTSPNPNLRPLKVKELEFGLELKFFQNRIGFDAAVYRKNTIDEILNVQISNASGYDFTKVNVGKLRNEGIELLLTGTILQGRGLGWESSFNVAFNRSEVVELANGQTALTVATQPDFAGIITHEVGKPMASLQGRGYARTATGQRVFQANGRPAFDNTIKTWGSAVPTYWGGWTNTFSFKGIRVSGLIDFKGGHKLISSTNYNLWRHGLHKGSLPGRDGGVLGDGVRADGSPNATRVANAQLFYGDIRSIGHFVEEFVYDASFIKLRQLTIGYDFSKLLKRSSLRGLTLSGVVNNVAVLRKFTPNIDPEQIGGASDNLAGIESGALPLTRSMGFNLNLKF